MAGPAGLGPLALLIFRYHGAAQQWLAKNEYDFIFAVGDDSTDEDLFRVMPESAVTIRVGIAATHARYNLRHSTDVIALLESFAQNSTPVNVSR